MNIGSLMKHIKLHEDILRGFGKVLQPSAHILDYGCGEGNMVQAYKQRGFEVHGCDVKLSKNREDLKTMKAGVIPFPNNTFDFIFSDQVFEHVQDHPKALAEIARVLKPTGYSLHLYPARLRPYEGHTNIPLGNILQNKRWLAFWNFLGIRNTYQKDKTWRKVADLNYNYLRNYTNYPPQSFIKRTAKIHFNTVEFKKAIKLHVEHGYGPARHIRFPAKIFPFIADIYGLFWEQVLFLENKKGTQSEDGNT